MGEHVPESAKFGRCRSRPGLGFSLEFLGSMSVRVGPVPAQVWWMSIPWAELCAEGTPAPWAQLGRLRPTSTALSAPARPIRLALASACELVALTSGAFEITLNFGPTSGDIAHTWPNTGHSWPKLVQIPPNAGQLRPNSPKCGRKDGYLGRRKGCHLRLVVGRRRVEARMGGRVCPLRGRHRVQRRAVHLGLEVECASGRCGHHQVRGVVLRGRLLRPSRRVPVVQQLPPHRAEARPSLRAR